MPSEPILLWLQRDLRLLDHPALCGAAKQEVPIIPVFIRDDEAARNRKAGQNSLWWLKKSLEALSFDLKEKGLNLILRCGSTHKILNQLAEETGAKKIFATAMTEPWAKNLAQTVRDKTNLDLHLFRGERLFTPGQILTKTGKPFRVFTPFSKAAFNTPIPSPKTIPEKLLPPKIWPESESPETVFKDVKKESSLGQHWIPGEEAAHDLLDHFIEEGLGNYKKDRNIPSIEGTSRLSPYLHFGEISANSVWHRIEATGSKGAWPYLREILWREFAHECLETHPDMTSSPMRSQYTKMPWRTSADDLTAWQNGQTGIPMVDAGMRQLKITGWMHNRVRMIVGSFLVKHLLLPWQEGEKWFWQHLVDADEANNGAGWQWVTGCGVDAAPYFRIMNPVRQGENFDPDGHYIRQWIPELSKLPAKYIHNPSEAPKDMLEKADIVLGENYPHPIISLKEGRERALAALKTISN